MNLESLRLLGIEQFNGRGNGSGNPPEPKDDGAESEVAPGGIGGSK